MSYGRAYAAGDAVQVDETALTQIATLGRCTIPAVVLEDSNDANWQVLVEPEGYEPTLMYKDKVTP